MEDPLGLGCRYKNFVDLIELIKSIAFFWIGMWSFSVLTMQYHDSLIKLVLVDNNRTHAASVLGHKHIKNGVPLSEKQHNHILLSKS